MIKNYDQELEKRHHPENFDAKEMEEMDRDIGYAVEDGRLDYNEAGSMSVEDKREFLSKQMDYDPY